MSTTDMGGAADGDGSAGGGSEGGQSPGVRGVASSAGQTVKEEAAHFAEAAQEKVMAKAEAAKGAASETLGQFATAVRRAGDELAQNDQSMAGRLVQQAANGLEHFSRSLADKGPMELLDGVRDFGRRSPAAFIGGAVLVGVALGRFARSSAPAPAQQGMDGGFGAGEGERSGSGPQFGAAADGRQEGPGVRAAGGGPPAQTDPYRPEALPPTEG